MRSVFENVIVGVEGRAGGRDAIALAGRLLDEHGQLTLVNVHGGSLNPVRASTPGRLAEEQERSHELLERERTQAEVQAELVSYVASSPGHGLHELAEERRADLLVVGSCGRGHAGRVLLGDDTRASLNGASCAVAVASRHYADHPLPITTVGVGYDGSPESEVALALARELAARRRSTLRALDVLSLPSYAFAGYGAPALGDEIEQMLAEAKQRMDAIEGVDGRAVYGLPGEELAAFSDELQLLIVGSRGYGPMKRLILGSTSNYLESHARCSLLVLPRAAGGAPRQPE
jgi:nucleotide-binding universal stress UspA family protein